MKPNVEEGKRMKLPAIFARDENSVYNHHGNVTSTAIQREMDIPEHSFNKETCQVNQKTNADKDNLERTVTSTMFDITLHNMNPEYFDTVQVQTSLSKENTVVRSQSNIRKMANFKDIPLAVRKFKAATPYQKPIFLDKNVNDESKKNASCSFSEVDIVPISKSTEEIDKKFEAHRPTVRKTKDCNTLAFAGDKRNRLPWLPVPFKKHSDLPKVTRSVVQGCNEVKNTESSECDVLKNLSLPKKSIKADENTSDEIKIEKNTAVIELERYYSHLQCLITGISNEMVLDISKMHEDKKVIQVNSKQRECNTNAQPEEELSYTKSKRETEESSGNMDHHNSPITKEVKKMENNVIFHYISSTLLYVLWFLKQYLLLAFITIRYFFF